MKKIMWVHFIIYNFQISAFMMGKCNISRSRKLIEKYCYEHFTSTIILDLNGLILRDGDIRLNYGCRGKKLWNWELNYADATLSSALRCLFYLLTGLTHFNVIPNSFLDSACTLGFLLGLHLGASQVPAQYVVLWNWSVQTHSIRQLRAHI